jgi:hypothetical protein
MKKLILFLAPFLAIWCGLVLASVSVVTTSGRSASRTQAEHAVGLFVPGQSVLRKTSVTIAADVNDGSATMVDALAYGWLERIVIYGNLTDEVNEVDTAYAVTITDSDGVSLLAVTDCNTLSDPHSYAISISDVGSTEFVGVPFGDGLILTWADANDVNLPSFTVTAYWRESWQ